MPRRIPASPPLRQASPHAAAAARAVLDTLAQAGKHVASPHEAVQLGYLSIYDWCEVLDQYRERYGVGKPKADQ